MNERHYGALTGLNKTEMSEKLGEEQVYKFRRSWDLRPSPLNKNSSFHPSNIDIYKNVPNENIPDTESLKDTYSRVVKYYEKEIKEKLNRENILIAAHGNSIRALCKYLFKLDEVQISKLEIPTGNPLLIEFNNTQINSCRYLSKGLPASSQRDIKSPKFYRFFNSYFEEISRTAISIIYSWKGDTTVLAKKCVLER